MPNRPLACMGAEVKTQTSIHWKNICEYPYCNVVDSPTQASAKTLPARLEDASKNINI